VEQTTRERILDHLKRDGGGTIASLSALLGLAPSTVRQHVQVLIGQRLLSRDTVVKGRGRPETHYHLTPEGQQRYARRHAQLLEELLQTLGPDGARDLFAATTRRKVSDLAHIRAVADPDQRLQLAIDQLPDLGDLHERESVDGGADLHLYDCPFTGADSAFPHVCHMILDTLREITGAQVELAEWLRTGDRRCTIRVRHAQPGPAEPEPGR